MLKEYIETLAVLPDLLTNRSAWKSLIVNRRKPFTYRVFTKVNGLRCCLHKFDPCHTHEAFKHPHPWKGGFGIMDGSYLMKIGTAKDRFSQPDFYESLVMTKFSMYSIENPLTFHSVIPLETTYTIMVNEEPWPEDIAHTEVRTTKGKDLDTMPEDELIEHLAKFKTFVKNFNNLKLNPNNYV